MWTPVLAMAMYCHVTPEFVYLDYRVKLYFEDQGVHTVCAGVSRQL